MEKTVPASLFDNGFDKVTRTYDEVGKLLSAPEVSDDDVIDAFSKERKEVTVIPDAKKEVPLIKEEKVIAPKNPARTMTLRDGKLYSFDSIDTNMLLAMGYSKTFAGKLMKIIC